MIFASASQFHFYLLCLMPVQHSALAGTFSLIVKSLRRFVSSSSAVLHLADVGLGHLVQV